MIEKKCCAYCRHFWLYLNECHALRKGLVLREYEPYREHDCPDFERKDAKK